MTPPSHFLQYFPLVVDSLLYGVYSVLFSQAMHILLSRRRPNYKLHIAAMCALFLLSTLHVLVAWAWAFTTDTATTGIYAVFTLSDPPPALWREGDPAVVHRFAMVIKVRYTLAKYVFRVPSLLRMQYWRTYINFNLPAILLESGLIYPAALIITIGMFLSPVTPTVSVFICLAAMYHIVGIAPTLIIVRVGLGVSTDDVEHCISTLNAGSESQRTALSGLRFAQRPEIDVNIPVSALHMGSRTETEVEEGSVHSDGYAKKLAG
ncbi:Ras-GEF domain-containing protein [Mycena kentingensis (nom. inval.)]|nr:Ras-GEF domain-containing protein [Mycena kentingensis (nom. inval.)]